MVELANRNDLPGIDQVTSGVAQMLDAGVDKAELLTMFQTIVDQHESVSADLVAPNRYAEDTVFAELPEGLIDIPSAAKKYKVNPGTLRTWIHKGHIAVVGRLKAPARGGGYSVVQEQDLLAYILTPKNRGGRPRKT